MHDNAIIILPVIFLVTIILAISVSHIYNKALAKRKQNIIDEIEKYTSFRENWDGGSGKVISKETVDVAKCLIYDIETLPEVMPSPLGGVTLSYVNGDHHTLDVLVLSKDKIVIIERFPDCATNETTIPLRPSFIIERVKEFYRGVSLKEHLKNSR